MPIISPLTCLFSRLSGPKHFKEKSLDLPYPSLQVLEWLTIFFPSSLLKLYNIPFQVWWPEWYKIFQVWPHYRLVLTIAVILFSICILIMASMKCGFSPSCSPDQHFHWTIHYHPKVSFLVCCHQLRSHQCICEAGLICPIDITLHLLTLNFFCILMHILQSVSILTILNNLVSSASLAISLLTPNSRSFMNKLKKH